MMGRVTPIGLPGTGDQHSEIENDYDGDKDPQNQQELALRDQIGLASLVDQLRNLAHGAVYRQVAQAGIDRESKAETQKAENYSNE